MGRRAASRTKGEGEPRGLERPVAAGASGSEAVACAAAKCDPAKIVAGLDPDWVSDAWTICSWKAAPPTRVSGQLACSVDDDGKRVATRMEAENVFTVPLHRAVIVLARSIFESLRPTVPASSSLLSAPNRRWAFHVERPGWKSDIAWVAANDAVTFRSCFQMLFDRLEVARLFGFLGEMVLFSGFFVSRRSTTKSHFHTDFSDTGKRAYTLMTPLFDMSGLPDCQLLCRLSEEVLKQYRYQLGRAIVFGDQFLHATETGAAPRTLAFLCFVRLRHAAAVRSAPCPTSRLSSPPPPLAAPCRRLASGACQRRSGPTPRRTSRRSRPSTRTQRAPSCLPRRAPLHCHRQQRRREKSASVLQKWFHA